MREFDRARADLTRAVRLDPSLCGARFHLGVVQYLSGEFKGAAASVASVVIAWIDTRPNWDDTGITAGLLLLSGGIPALLGAPWWVALTLVVAPLLLAEVSTTGWGLLLAVAFALLGALGGAGLRWGMADRS